MSLDLKRVAQIGHKGEREGISGRHSSPTAEAMDGNEKSRRRWRFWLYGTLFDEQNAWEGRRESRELT
jgi:hypothetical protein